MKKFSMYLGDQVAEQVEALAAREGVSFAEMTRRLLAERLSGKLGADPMSTVRWVIVHKHGDDEPLTYKNVEVEHERDSSQGIDRLWIQRGERTLASFNLSDVSSWYVEE